MAHGYQSPWMDEELRLFRASTRRLIREEFAPQQERWRAQRAPDPDAWTRAGEAGLLCPEVPAEYEGNGGTFAHAVVVVEELAREGVNLGVVVHNMVSQYLLAYGSEEQKSRWLPRLVRGELVGAVAMTEPGAGSDVQGIASKARRDGDSYVLNGSKTFVTNAALAGLVCVAVRTDTSARGWQGISLVFVEPKGLQGCRVGRPLAKVGMHGQDTCEIFFDDVRIPASSLLGPREGIGFSQMMERLPYERLLVGASGVASSERAVELTVQHAKDRKAYGKRLLDLQTTRATLAECQTRTRIGRVFLDSCVQRFIAGQSDDVTAAMAKYWLTESQFRTIDACLQIFGGYGYMEEYAIARMWADSRVQRIYGGANEVMQEIVAWSL